MKILLTGAAGFIGMHTSLNLLRSSVQVVGLDYLGEDYIALKEDRLNLLFPYPHFSFHKVNICDREATDRIFREEQPHYVIHLASQAGVRYSIINPYPYVETNLNGFINVLECYRTHLVNWYREYYGYPTNLNATWDKK